MPQRVMTAWVIVIGIAGLLLVAVLAGFGRDLVRASRTGPRWKRRMVASAIVLLGLLGVTVGTNTSCIFTCYVPAAGATMDRGDFRERLEHLNQQLPLLEKFAAADKLDPDVVTKVLYTCRFDVEALESEFARKKLSAEEFARAQDACRTARGHIERVQGRLDAMATTRRVAE